MLQFVYLSLWVLYGEMPVGENIEMYLWINNIDGLEGIIDFNK